MAHDVFLSYSSKDRLAANAACNVLERNGVRVWMALCGGLIVALAVTGQVPACASQSACLPGVVVQGLVFAGAGKPGDFRWMAAQPSYGDALFIFNDNVYQFKAFVPGSSKPGSAGCAAGGGNAGVRPLQCSSPPRTAGIPTGPGFSSLTPERKALIDEAMTRIVSTVRAFGYKRLYYSAANDKGDLGTGIFKVGRDVKQYIVERLKSFPTKSCL